MTAGAGRKYARPAGATPARGITSLEPTTTESLEAEVYAARDLHGDERGITRQTLTRARALMSEDTYRRALQLARDSALLTVEECLDGARAMEWQPLPRPEFSLATIEAAVAEEEQVEFDRNNHGI